MDIARACPFPPKVAYIAYMRHFCFEFNKKSLICTEISTVTFFYIAYAVILLAFDGKKNLHGVQIEFNETFTDMTEPLEL